MKLTEDRIPRIVRVREKCFIDNRVRKPGETFTYIGVVGEDGPLEVIEEPVQAKDDVGEASSLEEPPKATRKKATRKKASRKKASRKGRKKASRKGRKKAGAEDGDQEGEPETPSPSGRQRGSKAADDASLDS